MRGKILVAVAAAALTVTVGALAQVGGIPARLRLVSLGVGVAAPAGDGNIAVSGTITGANLSASTSFNSIQYLAINGAQAGFLQADGNGVSVGTSSNHPLSLYSNGVIGARLTRPADGGRFDALNGFSVNGAAMPAPSDIARLSQANTFSTTQNFDAGNNNPQLQFGTWNVARYVGGNTLEIGGYTASQWIGLNLYANGSQVASLTPSSINLQAASVQVNGSTIRSGAFARLIATGVTKSGGCVLQSAVGAYGVLSCTNNGNGDTTVTFSQTFTTAPACTATPTTGPTFVEISAVTTTTVRVVTRNSAGTATDQNFHVTCIGL